MLQAVSLRVEYKINPLGMDEPAPRFSYELSGRSEMQTAYRIVILDEDKKTVWDSGFVESGICCQIVYAGEKLKPFTRYDWSVQVKDEHGKAGRISSEEAFFETGFLDSTKHGKWITMRTLRWSSEWSGGGYQQPPLRFLRKFEVKKKVVKARLYTAALGLYEAYINGKIVTDEVFTPGWTDYYHRVQYQAYDVTKLIVRGQNMLADVVGEGWFCGTIARYLNGGEPTYGKSPAIWQELHLTYTDGRVEVIASDHGFSGYHEPPAICMSDIYMGETYNANEDDTLWKLPENKSQDLSPAVELEGERMRDFLVVPSRYAAQRTMPQIEWQSGASVRRIMTRKPVQIVQRKETGSYIVDFGQNLTGRERLRLKKTYRGSTILIRHGEMLNEDGSLYVSNLRGAAATTVYHAANAENVVYEPHFTYYGFRYLEIIGWCGTLTEDQIEAVVIHSDLPLSGDFHCSDPLVEQLYQNIVWGQRCNFLDVPTDCPQRDERLGWTGDTQVFANAATYNMYCPEFYTKWIRDLNLTQSPRGAYRHYVPDPYGIEENVIHPGPAAGWADAAIICPDVMFRKYGDLRILRKYFHQAMKYLKMQVESSGKTYLVNYSLFGDWLNIDDHTDGTLLSTAYLAGMLKILAHHAELLDLKKEQAELETLASAVKKAFQKKYFRKGRFLAESQTSMLLALHFDLVPENAYRELCRALVKNIREKHRTHLSTGFLGTPLLLKTLTRIGEVDLAYALLQQKSYPGWLYPVTQGATTMWERWNSWNADSGFADVHMNSFNHYAYGAVADWFFETICGIQPVADTVEQAGFKYFKLAPRFGSTLSHAGASYHSPYGKICSAWKHNKNMIVWEFSVPRGSVAEIDLPYAGNALAEAGIERDPQGKWIAHPGSYTVKLKG